MDRLRIAVLMLAPIIALPQSVSPAAANDATADRVYSVEFRVGPQERATVKVKAKEEAKRSRKAVTDAKPRHRKARSASRSRNVQKHAATKVAGWQMLPDPIADICKPMLEIKGKAAFSEDGALEKANDAWAEAVQSDWGARYMDLRFSSVYAYRCWRTSAKDKPRLPGLSAGEIHDALEYRCEVRAVPCMPPWKSRETAVPAVSQEAAP